MYDELEKRANRMRQAQSELSERTKEHSDNMDKEAEVQSKKKEQPAYDAMVGQLQSKVEESLSKLSNGKFLLYISGHTRFSFIQKMGPPVLVYFLAFAFHLVLGLFP